MLVHIEAVPQQVRLVTPSLFQALKFRLVKVIFQDRLIIGVRTLLDDDTGALTRRESAYISEALFGDNNVKVVLCLIDVRAHGHDAGNTSWVGLRRARGRCVHDRVF